MNPSLQRAQLLYQQRRYDLAAAACREALTTDAHDAFAHALLAMCLLHLKQYDQASAEAALAIHLAPDSAFGHYASGIIFQERNYFAEAEVAAREAIRLVPENPDHWGLLAQTMIARQRWREALEAADQGLHFDPENTLCINLRAVALVKLGDKTGAAQTINEALRRNPHDALSHANQGWNYLHQGKPREALEHFREALRLNPNDQWARDGMVQALKAHYFIYRMMLRYYLWMSRFNRKGQWGVIIGLWIGMQIVRGINEAHPGLELLTYPLMGAYILFVLASWLADPIFSLTLLASRNGRYLLQSHQMICSAIIGILLLAALVLLPLGWFLDHGTFFFLAGLLAALLTLPTAATMKAPFGRWIMGLYTAALAITGALSLALLPYNENVSTQCLLAAAWGCVLSGLASNILSSIIRKK